MCDGFHTMNKLEYITENRKDNTAKYDTQKQNPEACNQAKPTGGEIKKRNK